jgi:putative spermidine/putrescine transport system permease protein
MVILGRHGLINNALGAIGIIDAPLKLVYNTTGVYIGMMHVMLPFLVLPLYSVLCRIDLRLLSAAETLGASPLTSFFWVVLPLSMPGILAGALLVFMSSVGLFVIPALLGGLADITYVMAIERQVNELNNWELAAAMSMLLLLVTGLLSALYEQALSLNAPAGVIGLVMRAVFQRGPIALLTWWQRLSAALHNKPGLHRFHALPRHLLARLVSWAIIFCLVAPLVVIFPLSLSNETYLHFPPNELSLRWFENYFSRDDWLTPTITSIEVGLLTTVGATLIGVPAAYAVVRGRFPGKGIVTAILLSPMIVPVMILAIALYAIYAKHHLIGTVLGLVLAHMILALPYVVLIVSAGLRSTDESLELVALTLGAGRLRAFLKVTLPLLRPAVLSGAFFAFLASFDDLVMALFLSGTRAKTLPLRMWEGIRFEIDPTTAAVSVLLIILSLGLVFGNEWVRRGAEKRGVRQPVGPA